MTRLTLVPQHASNTNLAHRASTSEGEAVRRLLESQGYEVKGPRNKQYECRCPFHEGPGALGKSPNFYIDATTSKFFCQAASCGEKGNLRLLERYFGLDEDDDYVASFKGREARLKEFELNLVPSRRQPFHDHGLTDVTIERFRLGYEEEHEEDGRLIPGRYVIPYLESRRPRFFRYYSPDGDPKWKYTWEPGAESMLFNVGDAIGDAQHGIVVICEGEQKAMLLAQLGYCAVAVPGASNWKEEYQGALTHARRILVCYDNDNPLHPSNNYDKPERDQRCVKCSNANFLSCIGHNPGQEQALRRVEQLGWRAKNLVLPLPDESVKKTDINDYFIRDGHSNADFAELATGKRATPHKVLSLKEIMLDPPDEADMLVDNGILTVTGRLLIAGKPKVGKSLLANNLALSLASGLPFLRGGSFRGFKVDHPTRVMLLDRELSKRSLFDRLTTFTSEIPAYQAAQENLLIDHDHLLKLDQAATAYDLLCQLVDQNGAEVVILDTAYKFFNGDVESSTSVMKAFGVLDKVMHETGCAFVLTHHLRKSQTSSRKENSDVADPDNVVGSFIWTGWPNATILLNYMNRSVENPFNAVATFTAFRDAAPPDPLALYRSRESITYNAVEKFVDEEVASNPTVIKPTTEAVASLLLQVTPTTEDDFLHMASGHFGVSIATVKPYFIDAMSSGEFERTKGKPPVIQFRHDRVEQTWEQEHGLNETKLPADKGLDLSLFEGSIL